MPISVLQPGILVSLKTTIRGGVFYARKDLPVDTETDTQNVARWETTRLIADKAENDRAIKARSAARTAISSVCTHTNFGLLCLEAREQKLDEALLEARKIVDTFNATAAHSHIRIYLMKGRVASNDEEAAKAIADEVSDVLGEMQKGIQDADPEAIREAANRARQLGAVLEVEQGKAVSKAVEAARTVAKEIIKRVQKNGELADVVLADLAGYGSTIDRARVAFLDLSEGPGVADAPAPENQMPAVDVQRVANLELG